MSGMTAIVAGGRNYRLTQDDIAKLDALPIDTVVHGDCSGVDKDAAQWASHHSYTVWAHPADWKKYGKAAGPIRNREMVKIADVCVLFPGGRGTDDMFRAAVDAGLQIYDYRNQGVNSHVYLPHLHLMAAAEVAIRNVSEDDSVPVHKARSSLTELKEKIDDMINGLRE